MTDKINKEYKENKYVKYKVCQMVLSAQEKIKQGMGLGKSTDGGQWVQFEI